MLLQLILATVVALYLIKWYFGKRPHWPDGPRGLPFIGTWHLTTDVYDLFDKYVQRYGPVFSYQTFGTDIVILNDHESVREILVKQGDKVRDRPQSELQRQDVGGNFGLLFENGDIFTEQRRFALSTLRDFGFGKPILEAGIIEEAQQLIKVMIEDSRKSDSIGINLTFYLNNAVSNVINKVVFGRRFEYTDEAFFKNMDRLNFRAQSGSLVNSLGIKPWIISCIPGAKRKLLATYQAGIDTRNYLRQFIDTEKNRVLSDSTMTSDNDNNNPPETYIDAFTRKQMMDKDGQFFSDHQLTTSVENLFAAGTETTSTTLRWSILYFLRHPDIQEKVFEEIRSVIGVDRYPTGADRPHLPFTEATILETQRIGRLVPIFGRKAVETVQYKQYRFPPGTCFLASITALHMNPDVWTDPKTFRPERFLTTVEDDNDEAPRSGGFGKVDRTRADLVYAFGAGKRKCLGESLARMELFLMFTTLAQRLRFTLPPGRRSPPSEKPLIGITSQTVPFNVVVQPRYQF